MNKILLTTPLLGASALMAQAQGATEQPNIVLINVDDLGWADFSYQGSKFYETPNIDKLKAESVYFPNGYAAAANSAPSRASMLTGCYSPRHGVFTVGSGDRGKSTNRKLNTSDSSKVPDAKYTLMPETLKKHGYTTCHVGKWHIGSDPTEQGIDHNIGGNMMGHPKSYFAPYGNPNLKDGPDGEYLTDRITTDTIEYLKNGRDKTKPFFLYFATYAVHGPLQAKPELISKYNKKPTTEAQNNSKFAGLVETMDTNVGRLLDYLKESGLEDNTLIIFTADNGGVYNFSKQWPLRAGKGSFYEGGIRVPVMVKWKGHTQGGTVNETPVINLDYYPTFLEAAGIPQTGLTLDGKSLLPVLEGKEPAADKKNLYWHFPAYLEGGNEETTDPLFRSRPVSVVRSGDWKLIYNYETEKSELYNLKEDISEKKDLAESNTAKRDELYGELKNWLSSVGADTNFELNPGYGKGESDSKKDKSEKKDKKADKKAKKSK